MARAKTKETEERTDLKLFARGTKEFRHDLYRSSTEKMARNKSFQKGVVDLIQIDHVHFYHSHDSHGRKLKRTNTIGGHFHEVTEHVDQNGNLVAKCGPPLREITKKRASGPKLAVVPVRWLDNDAEGDGEYVVDNHTHSFTYEGSETLSGKKIQAIQRETQAAIAKTMPIGPVTAEPDDPAPKDDGETLEEVGGDD